MKQIAISMIRSVNRKLFRTNWYDLRQKKPLSEIFGLDRGLPVDRYYIEQFLSQNRQHIKGTVVEVGDDRYSQQFGQEITRQEVLRYAEKTSSSMTGDLTDLNSLAPGVADCLICTQTLNFIFDVKAAVKGIHFLLKKGGTALVTVAGISQISRYDMERWGDFWRFTDKSLTQLFGEVFGFDQVQTNVYGNVLTSVALLEGLSANELSKDELAFCDENYQIIIAVKATKNDPQ